MLPKPIPAAKKPTHVLYRMEKPPTEARYSGVVLLRSSWCGGRASAGRESRLFLQLRTEPAVTSWHWSVFDSFATSRLHDGSACGQPYQSAGSVSNFGCFCEAQKRKESDATRRRTLRFPWVNDRKTVRCLSWHCTTDRATASKTRLIMSGSYRLPGTCCWLSYRW